MVLQDSAKAMMVDYKAIANEIKSLVIEKNCAPILVRLSWHDAGTYDCSSQTGGPRGNIRFCPADSWSANKGLQIARNLLEPIKKQHPEISFADFFVLAAVVAIHASGGPSITFRPGREDELEGACTLPDGRLPDASKGPEHIREVFYRMGFNDYDIVVLSGAHTLGRCHPDRSGYEGPWTDDPLKFDNTYFTKLLEETWTVKPGSNPVQYQDSTGKLMMLPSDMALIWDEKFKILVEKYAKSQETFFTDFATAFEKLQELGWTNKLQSPVDIF